MKYTKKIGRGIATATIVKSLQNDLKNITQYNNVPQNFTLTSSENLRQLRVIAQDRDLLWYSLGIQIHLKYLSTYNETNQRQRETRHIHQERNTLQQEQNIRQQLASIQQRRDQIRQNLTLNAPRTPLQDQQQLRNNRLQLASNSNSINRGIRNRNRGFNLFGNGIPIIIHRHRTRQNSAIVDNNEVCQRLNMN